MKSAPKTAETIEGNKSNQGSRTVPTTVVPLAQNEGGIRVPSLIRAFIAGLKKITSVLLLGQYYSPYCHNTNPCAERGAFFKRTSSISSSSNTSSNASTESGAAGASFPHHRHLRSLRNILLLKRCGIRLFCFQLIQGAPWLRFQQNQEQSLLDGISIRQDNR